MDPVEGGEIIKDGGAKPESEQPDFAEFRHWMAKEWIERGLVDPPSGIQAMEGSIQEQQERRRAEALEERLLEIERRQRLIMATLGIGED